MYVIMWLQVYVFDDGVIPKLKNLNFLTNNVFTRVYRVFSNRRVGFKIAFLYDTLVRLILYRLVVRDLKSNKSQRWWLTVNLNYSYHKQRSSEVLKNSATLLVSYLSFLILGSGHCQRALTIKRVLQVFGISYQKSIYIDIYDFRNYLKVLGRVPRTPSGSYHKER